MQKFLRNYIVSLVIGVVIAVSTVIVFAASGDFWTGGLKLSSGTWYDIWRIDSNGDLVPGVNGTYDIGTDALEPMNLFVDGTAYIDDATIEGTLTVDSTLTQTGVATFAATAVFNGGQTRTQFIHPNSIALAASNPPTLTTTTGGTGNVWKVLQFENDGSSPDTKGYIQWRVPNGYVVDSLRANIIWSSLTAETATDKVVWAGAVLAITDGETADATTTAITAVTDENWEGTADEVFTTQINPEVVVIAVDDMVYLEIYPDASQGEFTGGNWVEVHGVELEWESTE